MGYYTTACGSKATNGISDDLKLSLNALTLQILIRCVSYF